MVNNIDMQLPLYMRHASASMDPCTSACTTQLPSQPHMDRHGRRDMSHTRQGALMYFSHKYWQSIVHTATLSVQSGDLVAADNEFFEAGDE